MLGVIVNTVVVIIGSLAGLFIGHRLSEELKHHVMTAAGVVTLIAGLQMGLEGHNVIVALLALILGGALGYALRLEQRIASLGESLRVVLPSEDGGRLGRAFLDSSVLFCAGAMTILGSFQSGTRGDHQLLFLKSTLDGFMSLLLSSSLGPGVLFSAGVIFIYQGGLVLGAQWLEPFLAGRPLEEIGSTGGLMVVLIGLDLLGLRRYPTANFLPSLLLVPLLVRLEQWLGGAG